ncbi:hypothetical protein K438DRAFT_1762353 [Mycena galopus ATCC 62051]|nr:hypothetical protein K438DRAFT_1762353 [Mycena galopus ATCC 62051]
MFRFQPYRRPNPVVLNANAPSVSPLSSAYQELRKRNHEDGILLSWSHGILNDWEEIARPQRLTSRGPVDIAASGFEKIWGKTDSPFFCPHTRLSGSAYKPLVLRLGGTFEGGVADYYRAIDHECAFKTIIKPLASKRHLLVTWEDRKRYYNDQEQEDDDEQEPPSSQFSSSDAPSSSQLSSSSIWSSYSNLSSATSVSSSLSSSSASSNIARLAVEAMVDPSPRASRPSPSKGPISLDGQLRQLRPYYGLKTADARRISDITLMTYLLEIQSSGLLEQEPTSHPAWDTSNPHPVLRVYDKRIYTHRTNCFLEFSDKLLGQIIRQLNSALGVPYGDYAKLVRATYSCNCCKNYFSSYGYNTHIKEGKCTNHPDLQPVDECEDHETDFRFRSFHNAANRPQNVSETLDSAVGAAMLEWNSRLGVPADVWMTVSTAIVTCKDCDLVRSFPGHLLHLDVGGNCDDPGQENILS